MDTIEIVLFLVVIFMLVYVCLLVVEAIRQVEAIVGEKAIEEMFMRTEFTAIEKRNQASRKRDENLLREIHLTGKHLLGEILLAREESNHQFDLIRKACLLIENNSGKCKNDSAEIKLALSSTNKCLKESTRILGLFEALTEKAKKGLK